MPEDLLLVLCGDGHPLRGDPLVDTIGRCAAAAGYRAARGEARSSRREWRDARAVILDAAAVEIIAAEVSRATMPARGGGVIVVGDESSSTIMWRAAIAIGADHSVALPSDEARLVSILGELLVPQRHPANAVAVIGGHGGAGASTLAATIAVSSSRGSVPTMLLDTDGRGPGIDLMLGIEGRPGVRWQDLTIEGGAVSGDVLRGALPHVDDLLTVLAPRRDDPRDLRADTVAAVMEGARAHGDLVVVDVPRAASEVTASVLDAVDLTVLITTATLSGCASSRAMVPWLRERGGEPALVVRGPAPSGLRASAVADAIGLPLLASYRAQRALAARIERDRLDVARRSPMGRAAAAILEHLDSVGAPGHLPVGMGVVR